jgi:hypothetical protein
MVSLFHASEALFQTGLLVESRVIPMLVIFIIRSRSNRSQTQARARLVATAMLVVGTLWGYRSQRQHPISVSNRCPSRSSPR